MTGNANLYAHFRRRFPADLSTLLLVTENGRNVSYAEAELASAKLAKTLLALGAQQGDRVTVQLEKSVENLFLYFACLRAGLIYHPLNTAYTKSELEYFLANAEPTIVVCNSNSLASIQALVAKQSVKSVVTLEADGRGTLMDHVKADSRGSDTSGSAISERSEKPKIALSQGSDIAALLYSSGTTGRPKGIMLSHDNLRKNAETLVRAWGFNAADRLLHMLPIYHVHGLFVGVSCVMMSGASMSWHSGFSATAAVSALPQCSVMMGVPTYYTRLLNNSKLTAECCQNMRLFISGSAPLLTETFIAFQARTGHTILERYGMTETGMNTSNPLHGERRAGTVGPALPGVEARVVDDMGETLAADIPGNLQVKGPNVFSGYWRMPDKTAEDFTPDGFFNTGDKATIDSDGYVAIVGRAKDMIITGGLNVYPKEVELVIDEIDGIKESAVIGIPHADFGEAVVAVVVKDDTSAEITSPTPEQIIAHCKRELANFKVPKQVRIIDALPRNAMGKVQKNRLRQEHS